MTPLNILILGASYGSLLATKIVLAGHNAKMICLPAEADLFNAEGAIIRTPVKGRDGLVEIRTSGLAGQLSAGGPADANPAEFDLIVLAMQEPQYSSPGVRDLLQVCGEIWCAMYVDYEYATAQLYEAVAEYEY
jgi:hypothetical protein